MAALAVPMNVLNHRQAVCLALSREEQWVLHHVLLDRIELETRAPADTDPPPLGVFQVFEKLDAHTGTETQQFKSGELWCVCEELRRYATESNIPERDQDIVTQLLRRITNVGHSNLGCNKTG
ncbi:hypothetical protein DMJ13_19650 [halophilic archaeon]|nr:hypothetical protein DMJ13_19650 [halophilic archaeon]